MVLNAMEQHPVPQNVTTFQFRLVGDMTVKQFGYLAVCLILGYICFKLPLPVFFTWPLAFGFAALGFGLAFVPIQERPMDVWILSFFRNVYAPTQYVWKKSKKTTRQATSVAVVHELTQEAKAAKRAAIAKRFHPLFSGFIKWFPFRLGTKPRETSPIVGSHRVGVLERLFGVKRAATPSLQTKVATHMVTPATATAREHWGIFDVFRQLFRNRHTGVSATTLSGGISPAGVAPKKESAAVPVTPRVVPIVKQTQAAVEPEAATTDEAAHRRILELQKELSTLLTDRERLSKEVVTLKTESRTRGPATVISGPGVVPAEQVKPSVRAVAAGSSAQIGVPRLTTFPNVIAGIVKDENGSLLSGILITVRDPNDVPIRAFKTNRIGQFAASTPLPNGPYIVEAEDPKKERVFDRIQISAAGTIMPTLEMFAKSKKQQTRDMLTKQIFGQVST